MEAALLIAIVTAGLLAMRFYLKGTIQGNWRTNIDSFSDEQFRPQKDWFGKNDPNHSHISRVPDGQAYDPAKASDPHTWQEQQVTQIRITDPKLYVKDINKDTGEIGGKFNKNFNKKMCVRSDKDTQILQVGGWGTYTGESEGEDDEE